MQRVRACMLYSRPPSQLGTNPPSRRPSLLHHHPPNPFQLPYNRSNSPPHPTPRHADATLPNGTEQVDNLRIIQKLVYGHPPYMLMQSLALPPSPPPPPILPPLTTSNRPGVSLALIVLTPCPSLPLGSGRQKAKRLRGQRSKDAREDEKGEGKVMIASSSTRGEEGGGGGGQISRACNPISRDSNDVITRINRVLCYIKYDSLRYTTRPDIYKTQRKW